MSGGETRDCVYKRMNCASKIRPLFDVHDYIVYFFLIMCLPIFFVKCKINYKYTHGQIVMLRNKCVFILNVWSFFISNCSLRLKKMCCG